MKQTKRRLTAILLCGLLLLSGCGAQNTAEDTSNTNTETVSSENITATTVSGIDTSGVFSDRDLAGTYDESAAIPIALNGDSASCNSSSVVMDNGTITITAEGVYLISGTLNDGQIIVDAGDTDKVQLVLAGADITSSTSAAIYALEADKVFITLAEGTENILTNGGEYVAIDDNNIDAVVFAKTDLTLNGSGSLTINAQAGHGVVSKDDLVITGGIYTITAASHGLDGKDSVAIAGGTFAITSGKDGIHAENSDDASLGWLYIQDGSFNITAQGDAISAQGALQIDGGTFDLYTGEGSTSVEMTSSGQIGGVQRGGWTDQTPTAETQTAEDSTSQKGIKGESTYAINGGTFNIDSADDCLHAGGEMVIAAGEFTLNSGDDAVHCDDALTIQSGTFTIPYCYEGIEGLSITIEDGVFDITSNDDGLNAAGGADSSGFGGFGNRQQDTFADSSDSFILINGGTFTVVSTGDCVDSNGSLTINGGTLNLTCNGSGNTAIDCDGTYTNNGGDVTTNDGSESNPGQMGGQAGRGGKGAAGSQAGTANFGQPGQTSET